MPSDRLCLPSEPRQRIEANLQSNSAKLLQILSGRNAKRMPNSSSTIHAMRTIAATTDQLRELLSEAGLGQREAVRALRLHEVNLNERQFRHYCTGKEQCPGVVYRALRDLANEITNN